jgi:hypothetical protein
MWTIALQVRRLRTKEPEDGEFLFRKWADFQFLIVALWRLRRTAELASRVPEIAGQIRHAIIAFDTVIPDLKKMRDVAEHFDEYALDSGRDKSISRRSLEVASVGPTRFEWLGFTLDTESAVEASSELFAAIKSCPPKPEGCVSLALSPLRQAYTSSENVPSRPEIELVARDDRATSDFVQSMSLSPAASPAR